MVPLGDSERDDQSIKIEQGESLCITGTLDSGGFLSELGVVSSARDVSGPIIELRLDNSRGTRLVIRHSGTNWLEYRAHTIATPQDLAFPTSTLPVGPGAGNVESWKGERKLLLHGFRFLEGRSEQEVLALTHEPRTRNTSVFNASVTFGLWGGERGVDFGTPERRARARRFRLTAVHQRAGGGLDLDFTFGRVRAGVTFGAGGRTVQHGSTGTELSIGLAEIGFTLGYDVVRYEQLHAFVSTGIIGSSLYVDLAPGLTAFPDVKPWEGERVEFSASSWPVEIGTDYFIPLGRASATEYFILQFGTRVGWIEQLGGGVGRRMKETTRGSRRATGRPLRVARSPRARHRGSGTAGSQLFEARSGFSATPQRTSSSSMACAAFCIPSVPANLPLSSRCCEKERDRNAFGERHHAERGNRELRHLDGAQAAGRDPP